MYLTPSIIDGILRASIALIVHPTDGDAQITSWYYYALFSVGFFITYHMSITKEVRYSKSSL